MNLPINNIFFNNFNNNMKFQNNNNSFNIPIKYPHKVGLQNIGQTRYMNSTIQCMSNIPEISDYLINNFNVFNSNTHPLTLAFNNLLINLLINPENKKYINPKYFKSVVGELNPLFEGYQAGDSKDLLFFLIERLHSELNMPKQNNFPNQIKDFNQLEIQARNKVLMFNNFIQEFNNVNNSKISDIFYGVISSTMSCKGCNVTKYSYQTFNMQIFQLKKFKDDKIRAYGQQNVKLNLMDCFIFSANEEILDGDNMIYCNNCKKLTIGKNKQDIYSLPKILIIVLNRGKNNADFNEEFEFPEYLDFSNQHLILNPNSKMKFYLMSIITHLGESDSSGHFIAYVRKGTTNQFLCYNDAVVSEVTSNEALKSKISNKGSEKITPYILFYHYFD